MATKKKALQAAAGTAGAAGGAAEFTAIEDVFSTYLYTGNGAAQVIQNGINLGQSNGSGSIELNGTANTYVKTSTSSSFSYGTGDFTYEAWIMPMVDDGTLNTSNRYIFDHGIGNQGNLSYNNGTLRYYNNTVSVNDTLTSLDNYTWAHVAVMRSSGTTYVFKNGVLLISFADSHNFQQTNFILGNFNSNATNSFKWNGLIADVRVSNTARYGTSFTPPTGHFTSDANTILLTGYGDDPLLDNGPNSLTLTANGEAATTTFGPFDAAEAGQGGMVWIKERGGTDFHILQDTERGAGKSLFTNNANAEGGNSGDLIGSFNANGFSVNNDYLGGANTSTNGSGQDMASWTFRKAPRFFDVVTYTGTGNNVQTVQHNLNTDVGAIIVKSVDSDKTWHVWHKGLPNPATSFMYLNYTDAAYTATDIWGNTAPTDTQFTVGTNSDVNGLGITYVAYLFAHDPLGPSGDGSDGLIACGSYTATGSPLDVDLGWEPQFIITRNVSRVTEWNIQDTMRGMTHSSWSRLMPHTSDAEFSLTSSFIVPTATGFRVNAVNNEFGNPGETVIYIAIRRGPMRQPTSGTEVFKALPYNGNGTTQISLEQGVLTDLGFFHHRNTASGPYVFTRLIGDGLYLRPSGTNVEQGNFGWKFDTMQGMYLDGSASYINGSTDQNVLWQFKRAAGFFDVVAYTGNGVAGHTVPHNLGVAPELMLVKSRDLAVNWLVYSKDVGGAYYGVLSGTNAFNPATPAWNDTDPTATEFTLGTYSNVNSSELKYVAYLFASVPGVSKIGSYNGDGTANRVIDCGFTSGARFVMIKATNTAGDWLVFDTARGIVAGNDALLRLNSTTQEVTSFDIIEPAASGFAVTQDGSVSTNESGQSYIFLAIA